MVMYSLKNNYDCICIILNKEIVVVKCYIVYVFKMVWFLIKLFIILFKCYMKLWLVLILVYLLL